MRVSDVMLSMLGTHLFCGFLLVQFNQTSLLVVANEILRSFRTDHMTYILDIVPQ